MIDSKELSNKIDILAREYDLSEDELFLLPEIVKGIGKIKKGTGWGKIMVFLQNGKTTNMETIETMTEIRYKSEEVRW